MVFFGTTNEDWLNYSGILATLSYKRENLRHGVPIGSFSAVNNKNNSKTV